MSGCFGREILYVLERQQRQKVRVKLSLIRRPNHFKVSYLGHFNSKIQFNSLFLLFWWFWCSRIATVVSFVDGDYEKEKDKACIRYDFYHSPAHKRATQEIFPIGWHLNKVKLSNASRLFVEFDRSYLSVWAIEKRKRFFFLHHECLWQAFGYNVFQASHFGKPIFFMIV